MKNLASLLLMLALIASLGLAQEEPIPPRRTRAMKFGALGGFTPGWLKLDVGPVNDFLQAGKGAALSSDGMILLGGAGAAYIMVVPNLRIGGWGMSGSLKSTSLEEATGIRRDAELNAGFGGVTVEYVFPIVERLDVAVGAMLGGGGSTSRCAAATAGTSPGPMSRTHSVPTSPRPSQPSRQPSRDRILSGSRA